MKRTVPPCLPQGPQHYWRQMVALSRAGGFAIADVHGRTNGRSLRTVKQYVLYCAEHGHIVEIGERPTIKNRTAKIYRVRDPRLAAPICRRPDFADRRGRSAQQMWNTMRRRGLFTARELAIHASTDVVLVKEKTARAYIASLAKAGYVLPDSKRPDGRTVWKLMPAYARGQAAPALLQGGRVLYDRNLNRSVNLNVSAETGGCA